MKLKLFENVFRNAIMLDKFNDIAIISIMNKAHEIPERWAA